MELLQLQYFRETAKLQHMSKTAEVLHIAQPSLSQTIKRLEDELGLPLFDRKGRNIYLNQAGSIFLKYVDEIFSSLENANLALSELHSSEICRISLCIQSASALLPEIVQLLKGEIPALQIQIVQNPNDISMEQIDFIISSSYEESTEPHTRTLLKEPLMLALPATHPLAHQENITLSDLSVLDFVSLSRSSNLYNIIKHYCEQYHFTPRITTYVDNPGIMRDLLRANLGAAFIPQITWQHFSNSKVVMKPLTDCSMQRYLLLTENPNRYRKATVRKCHELLCDYFSSLAP